jgi:hypothetical protein
MTQRRRLWLLVPSLALLGLLVALVPTGSAAGGIPPSTVTIKIHGNRDPHFVVPSESIQSGGTLKIKNKTDPQKIGPHTFSLVVPGDIPRTRDEQRNCFHAHHICRRVATAWHKVDFSTGNVTVNPVDPGLDGWDQMGRLTPHRKGDSFFFSQPDEIHGEAVSAEPGTVLHFMCVIHPWMHGKIDVVAP